MMILLATILVMSNAPTTISKTDGYYSFSECVADSSDRYDMEEVCYGRRYFDNEGLSCMRGASQDLDLRELIDKCYY